MTTSKYLALGPNSENGVCLRRSSPLNACILLHVWIQGKCSPLLSHCLGLMRLNKFRGGKDYSLIIF